jgi:hypothetical protein
MPSVSLPNLREKTSKLNGLGKMAATEQSAPARGSVIGWLAAAALQNLRLDDRLTTWLEQCTAPYMEVMGE